MSAPPQGPHHRACGRPGEGAPTWSKETSQQMLRPGNRTGDITYIHTREGFVYPACRHRAASSKKIVGYAMTGAHANRIGPKRPGELAVRNCRTVKGVTIFHVESGEHKCTSAEYTATMNKYGFLASVGRTGVCYDNAAAESFNATCKKELVNRKIYHTRRKAIKEVTSWIELWYNQTRLHSAIGYRTPNEVHQEWRKTETAA